MMDDLICVMQRSARLVKGWGQERLRSGKTLAETLTLWGIPLWEVMAVDLARLHLPKALSRDTMPPFFYRRVRPYLSWAKHTALRRVAIWRSQSSCAEWPRRPVFLFLGFSAYIYREVLHPVVARLKRYEGPCPISLHDGRSGASSALLGEWDEFHSIWQHWDAEVKGRACDLSKALKIAVAELQINGSLPRIIHDQGRSLWPELESTFNWLFRVYLPLLLPQAVIARHFLERHRPALIISPDVADPRTRLYCLLGPQFGVPSLEVQMGEYTEASIEWRFFAADRLAVWGERARGVMLSHGVPEDRIIITGSPRHDSLVKVSKTEVSRIRTNLGVPEGSIMVLFASVYRMKEYEALQGRKLVESMKKSVFNAAEQTARLFLVVKPHPLENVQETKRIAGEVSNIRFADPRADIREMIKACDVFVAVTGSTTVTDALIANKLTIIPVFPGWVWSDQYVKSNAILAPRSAEEVTKCFRMVVDGETRARIQLELESARKRFLRERVFKADGRASARIEALALQMANLRR